MFLAFDGISSLPCHTAWISKLSEGITSSLPILFISHWGFGEKESLNIQGHRRANCQVRKHNLVKRRA